MQLTEYARTEVCVQPVTSYVTEPITTYLIIRSNGVKVDRSRPDHAMLPSGANVPMEQHFAYSIHADTPLLGCPTYIKSTLIHTTGCHTDSWDSITRAIPSEGYTYVREEHCVCLHLRLCQKSTLLTWSILHGRPRPHIRTVHRYRIHI